MQLEIEVLPRQVLRAVYRGRTTIGERRAAKLAIGEAAAAISTTRVLIDLRNSVPVPYESVDAIGVVSRVLESPSFGRLAYVVDPGAGDAVAEFLTQYGPHFCRVFNEQERACEWLAA